MFYRALIFCFPFLLNFNQEIATFEQSILEITKINMGTYKHWHWKSSQQITRRIVGRYVCLCMQQVVLIRLFSTAVFRQVHQYTLKLRLRIIQSCCIFDLHFFRWNDIFICNFTFCTYRYIMFNMKMLWGHKKGVL